MKQVTKKTLGQELRRCRAIAQLTLRQIEESTGISNAYLSQLENDKIKKPSANVLYKLSVIYGVEIDKFLFTSGIISDEPKKNNKILSQISKSQNLTTEEEKALLDYLAYLRFKKRLP
jgi:transcriptional regulator with XRE-family HTH domain